MPNMAQSPIQNEVIAKWKTPAWVQPANVRGNPNVPMGVNTPRLMDPPEEWARWLWRYPREVSHRPGIWRGNNSVALTSVQGLLLVMGCAPCGDGVQREQMVFFMRAAELLATPGLYRRLIGELCLNIETVPRLMAADLSVNMMVEDMAHLFAQDGITIQQVADVYEWAQTYLQTMSVGMDTVRRTEAMTVLRSIRDRTSLDPQDVPCPIQPAWWYPPEEMALGPVLRALTMPRAITMPMLTDMMLRQVAPPEAGEMSEANRPYDNGWNGLQIVYLRKKKNKKPSSKLGPKKKVQTDKSDGNPVFKMGAVLSIPAGMSMASGQGPLDSAASMPAQNQVSEMEEQLLGSMTKDVEMKDSQPDEDQPQP